MIPSDFNVSRHRGTHGATEHYVFCCRFQEVIYDFVGACGQKTVTSIYGLGVRARTPHGYAMEICKKRISEGNVPAASELYPTGGFIVRGSTEPNPVINDVA